MAIALNVWIHLSDHLTDAERADLIDYANDTDALGIDAHAEPVDTVERAVVILLMFDPRWLVSRPYCAGWNAESADA